MRDYIMKENIIKNILKKKTKWWKFVGKKDSNIKRRKDKKTI